MRSCRPNAAAALARFIALLKTSLIEGEQIDTETIVREALLEAENPTCSNKCEEALRQATRGLEYIMALRLLYEECEISKRNAIDRLLSEKELRECMSILRELHEGMRQLETELTLCRKRCGEEGKV